MSLFQALPIVVLAVIIALVPFALGVVLGFGAFIATPIVMIILLIATGALIAQIAPASTWAGVILAAVVIATVYATMLTLGETGPTAWAVPFRTLGRALQIIAPVGVLCGALLSLGVWLWSRTVAVR